MECIQERAFYYWRHGLYGHVQSICTNGFSDRPSNLFLTMYISLSKAKVGDTDEAIENLSRMKSRKDLTLVYDVCMYCISLLNKEIKSELKTLNQLLETNNLKSTNSLALFHATEVAWLFNLPELYNCYLDFTKKSGSMNDSMTTLYAWILTTDGKCAEALDILDQSTDEYIKRFDLMALYAKVICHANLHQFSESIQIISRILSKFNFPELNIEKCRMYMAMDKWNFSSTIIDDNKDLFFSSFEQNYYKIYEGLYNGRDTQEIIIYLDQFLTDCVTYEKKNWPLLLKISFSLLTICAQNLQIIDKILKIVMIACDSSSNSPDCVNVLGFHHLSTHNYVAALNVNQTIFVAQDQNTDLMSFPMEFQIRLLIDTGRYLEAQDMLDLFKLVDTHNMIYYVLQSKLLRKMKSINESVLVPLFGSLKVHFENYRNDPLPFGEENYLETSYERISERFIRFRLDSILEALEELTIQNYSVIYSVKKYFGKELISILEPIQKVSPNFNPFSFYLVSLYEAIEKPDEAVNLLHKILLSPTVYKLPECLTMASRIFYEKGDIDLAIECINNVPSEDSSLLQSIDFFILKAKVTSTAKDSIPMIIQLFEKAKTNNTNKLPFLTYLNFIDLCFAANDYQTATKFIHDATVSISHNTEKFMLLLRQVKSFAFRHQEEKSLLAMEKLQKHRKFESELILAKAEFYFDFLKDDGKYISILQNYSNEVKTAQSFMFLGDGFCKVKNFNSAISAYQRSLKRSEKDTNVIKKLILCCVSAHRFNDAVDYFSSYSSLLKNEHLFCIKFIGLMNEMKRYEEALQCASKVSKSLYSFVSLSQIEYDILTGQIKAQMNLYKESTESFNIAVSAYSKSLENAKDNPYTKHIKKRVSEIIYDIGMNYLNQNDRQKALEKFNIAIEFNPFNAAAVVALFNLYKGRSEIEKCQKICIDYLTNDPTNEAIALLFTSSQTTELSKSIPFLQNVLNAHPYYFRTLVRLVEICARCGKLQIANGYIEKAKSNEPGYYFVRGLYAQYVGNSQKANQLYKKAALSKRWELSAKMALFSLLVNPDRKFVIFEDQPLSSEEDLKEAESLLKVIRTDDATTKLLYCDLLLSYNTKETISEAYAIFTDLTNKIPGLVAAFLGQARCLTKQGDLDRANDILTSILSGNTFHENFSYFEESYLIRAYIISLKTNFTSAQHFVYLAIGLDRCCKKAWQMCAEINLKRKMYAEAANAFKYCWQLCDQKDLDIGYNYAYCSMKAKNYDTALIVCRGILDRHPEYRDLKEKIMVPSFLKIKS